MSEKKQVYVCKGGCGQIVDGENHVWTCRACVIKELQKHASWLVVGEAMYVARVATPDVFCVHKTVYRDGNLDKYVALWHEAGVPEAIVSPAVRSLLESLAIEHYTYTRMSNLGDKTLKAFANGDLIGTSPEGRDLLMAWAREVKP